MKLFLADSKTNLTLYMLIFFRGIINIHLHFMSILLIGIIQVVEILPQIRQGPTYFYIVNIMTADVLAIQGARASATIKLT